MSANVTDQQHTIDAINDRHDGKDGTDRLYERLAEIVEMRNTQTWRKRAACVGSPPNIWFPESGDWQTLAMAKDICSACPVRTECITDNRTAREGIYAGVGAKARRGLIIDEETT